MSLYDQIISVYPELEIKNFMDGGVIRLVDDGDGVPYIAKWEYKKPIPTGLKLGK